MSPYVRDVHAPLWGAAQEARELRAKPEIAVSIAALVRIADAIDGAIGVPIPDGTALFCQSRPVPGYPGKGGPALRLVPGPGEAASARPIVVIAGPAVSRTDLPRLQDHPYLVPAIRASRRH